MNQLDKSAGLQSAMRILKLRWSAPVIHALRQHRRTVRFNGLKLATGAQSKTLSATLKLLEAEGIVVKAGGYFLTPKGEELVDVATLLAGWGAKWKPESL